MAECISCGDFTKYNGGKCSNCYKNSKTSETITKSIDSVYEVLGDDEDDNKKVAFKSNFPFSYNLIKGKIAETIVQELFSNSGFNVFRYGMESTIPELLKELNGDKSEEALQIKRMPDFVIQNPNTKQVFLVEVKFRANGIVSIKNIENYPYKNAYIILVSKKAIKCITIKELQEGNTITESPYYNLENRTEFAINKNTISEFQKLAEQFLGRI